MLHRRRPARLLHGDLDGVEGLLPPAALQRFVQRLAQRRVRHLVRVGVGVGSGLGFRVRVRVRVRIRVRVRVRLVGDLPSLLRA